MGNSESSLAPYRYNFENPKFGDFDLSNVTVFKIGDKRSADAAEEFLKQVDVIYVDCEGDKFGSNEQKLGTVQIATSLNCCLIFHITKYRGSLNFLKPIFESNNIRKVFHDCSGDSAVLFLEHHIRVSKNNTDDIQIAHKVIESKSSGQEINRNTGPPLHALYEKYCGKKIPGNKRFNKKQRSTPGENIWIHNGDLFDEMVKYAAVDALAVCEIFAKQPRWMFEKDYQYRKLVERQIEIKIKNPGFEEPEISTSDSTNWGKTALFLGVGAIATAAVVSFATSDAETRETDKKKSKKKPDEECIIS